MRILDVGCGRGDFTIGVLAKKGSEVVGMDVSPDFLKGARSVSPLNCQFVLASATHWCFREGSFDQIHAHHVLEHVTDLDKALDGIASSLAPGGKLYLSFPYPFLERILGNLMEGYIGKNMHLRIIQLGEMGERLASRGIRVTSIEKRKFFTAILLLYRFIRGMPYESQSGLYESGDSVTRFLETVSKWTLLEPDEVDFGKKKYLKGFLILAKAKERVLRHILPHEYCMEAERI
jgi:ubiquinone/menaquinone biosynthesis C-methylase UbiE